MARWIYRRAIDRPSSGGATVCKMNGGIMWAGQPIRHRNSPPEPGRQNSETLDERKPEQFSAALRTISAAAAAAAARSCCRVWWQLIRGEVYCNSTAARRGRIDWLGGAPLAGGRLSRSKSWLEQWWRIRRSCATTNRVVPPPRRVFYRARVVNNTIFSTAASGGLRYVGP